MNPEMYIDTYLKKRLLPFIEERNVLVFIRPDLAPIHYSRAALQWFEENNIAVILKSANPPAVPEVRPIERYWPLCERELKTEPKAAKDDKEFKYRWKRASAIATEETIKKMMTAVGDKIKLRARMIKVNESE